MLDFLEYLFQSPQKMAIALSRETLFIKSLFAAEMVFF